MNKKILSFAVAAALVAPVVAHADIKLSGVIQAEAVSWEVGDGNENAERMTNGKLDDDMDRQTLTNDVGGTILNEGPNGLQFDFTEKLGGGMAAFARYIVAFNTSNNTGLDGKADAWLGLKGSNAYFRYGTITGAYKSSRDLIDPWSFTSLQASGTAGGMSGETYNRVEKIGNRYVIHTEDTATGGGMGLTNEGFVDGALEIGAKFGGFHGRIQGVVDDASDMNGAGLLELRYEAPSFAMWLAGAYTDLDDVKTNVGNQVGNNDDDVSGLANWKIGGQYKLSSTLKFALQYEDAEIGSFDGNQDGGQYILASFEAGMSNITFAGWVGYYMSDMDDNARILDMEGNGMDEDAIAGALGLKYHFSKRTQVYGGYRHTDSDNDFRDENAFTLGIRHTF